jgi:hypothetical protein
MNNSRWSHRWPVPATCEVVGLMKGDDEVVDKVADAAVYLVRPNEIIPHRFGGSIIEAGTHTLFTFGPGVPWGSSTWRCPAAL